MKNLPVDKLQNKTSVGLQIKVFKSGDEQQNKPDIAHRDDHYIFFMLTSGCGILKVDLQDVTVNAGQLFYILPSQVHYRIKTDSAEGWFLAVDVSLIAADFRNVFEQKMSLQAPCSLADYELKQYSSMLHLLHNEFVKRQGDKYYLPIIHALVNSFLALAASSFSGEQTAAKYSRATEITRQFKLLLATHSHTIKSPAEYASKLNVSSGYLNETIKKVTGSTVSYWIQQEIFNEAKRLLYHSDINVKEIAHKLGYTDYAYFIRYFRKTSGLSPLKFRLLNRK